MEIRRHISLYGGLIDTIDVTGGVPSECSTDVFFGRLESDGRRVMVVPVDMQDNFDVVVLIVTREPVDIRVPVLDVLGQLIQGDGTDFYLCVRPIDNPGVLEVGRPLIPEEVFRYIKLCRG